MRRRRQQIKEGLAYGVLFILFAAVIIYTLSYYA